jgi:hypothetical protein
MEAWGGEMAFCLFACVREGARAWAWAWAWAWDGRQGDGVDACAVVIGPGTTMFWGCQWCM